MKTVSLAVCGEDRFALQVLDLLYDYGHDILACITASAAVEQWAQQYHIATASLEALPASLNECDLVIDLNPQPTTLPASTPVLRLQFDTLHGDGATVLIHQEGTVRCLQQIPASLDEAHNGADVAARVAAAALAAIGTVVSRLAKEDGAFALMLGKGDGAELADSETLRQIAAYHRSNQTQRAYRNEVTLAEAFTTSAQCHAERIALIYGDRRVTYSELDALSNRVANRLHESWKARGAAIGSGTMVGISLPKSVELYAAMLGVLKTGAAYVPLDPGYPQERLNWMAEDCELYAVILNSGIAAGLGLDEQVERIDIDACFTAGSPAVPPPCDADADSLAISIFTSGSTGRPKGTLLENGNICHFAQWYIGHVALDESARSLQFSSVNFDASLLDIFPTFMVGGSLIVPSEDERHDFERLVALVDRQAVTHAFLPPALLANLPEADWVTLRHLVTGGDVCDPDTIERWSQGRDFHNIYGPTECTVLATTTRFQPGSNSRNIGRPIADTQVYLLDSEMYPVESGLEGELYIAGRGVGRGYLKRPELTEERFIVNPFSDESGLAMMYRTGDLAYWTPEGEIRFVGRADTQIKVRGFRVELGEIESAALAAGLFRHAAVVYTTERKIVAYVAGAVADDASPEGLRKRLGEVLPDYMVPAAIVEIPALPSTANGKIDRAELAARPVKLVESSQREAPRNDIEKTLVCIWAETLGLAEDEVGISDSFFNLGGHSILVSKMLLAVKKTLSRNASLARFMENPTIASLATLISDGTLRKGDQISKRVYTDMVLDDAIQPLAKTNLHARAPRHVLLTGANGFLGCFVLDELIRQTEAKVTCMVRGTSDTNARERMDETLRRNDLKHLIDHPRIEVITGDLDSERLGLSEAVYERLARRLDAIYHVGANVNHVYDYQYLYQANVGATLDILRLATTYRNKAVHYISTLSAASTVDEAGRLLEEPPAAKPPAFVNNGYNLTKWVSEHLIWQAAERGIDSSIYRPGNITGHATTGLCQPERNRILLLVKGSVQLGMAPAWEIPEFDISPVDFLARSIVALSLAPSPGHLVYHLHNPRPLTWIEYLGHLREVGYRLDIVDPSLWRAQLEELDESNALYDVVSFYLDEENEDIGDMQCIDYHRTASLLSTLGIEYPKKDSVLLGAHFRFLWHSGFLPDPDAAFDEEAAYVSGSPLLTTLA